MPKTITQTFYLREYMNYVLIILVFQGISIQFAFTKNTLEYKLLKLKKLMKVSGAYDFIHIYLQMF